jgi:uncharacterized protein (DUF302 family)
LPNKQQGAPYSALRGLLHQENNMRKYSFTVSVEKPIEDAIDVLKTALMNNKLGIISDVDVSGIVKNKLKEEMEPYRILGACNPRMAKTMIAESSVIGTLLPCTIVAREHQGITTFDFMDPEVVLGLAENETVNKVAKEAKTQLLKTKEDLEMKVNPTV